jgi:predicted enzyme related to lactoylglutathione lyase
MSADHGRYIWYELITTDVEAAKRFYGEVMGWTAEDMPGPDMTYTVVSADGDQVGGLMDIPPMAKERGAPPSWSGYVCVDDCDGAAKKIESLGGAVIVPPTDIPGIGRFAVVADPHGAVFEVMKPLPADPPRPRAAQGTPGHVGWHELHAGDLEADFAFYAEMFGWKKDDALDMGPVGSYQLWSNQDGQIGGMMTKMAAIPHPFWLYYVQVGDIDAAVGRITGAGGQVLMGPDEVPGGMWIVQAKDPQGAMFAVVGSRG